MLLRTLLIPMTMLALTLATTSAKAEEEQPLPRPPLSFKLQQVTVSATKTERDPIETPGEVNVIEQEEFQRTQAQSLDDVLRYQPGVDSQLGPRLMGESPNIRGLSDERVLLLIDGVRLNFQSGHKGRIFLDVDQLKRAEIVRGPGSALYGSQALGGVIALTTKDPADYLTPDTRFGFFQKFGYQGVNDELLSSTTGAVRLGKQWEVMGSGTFRAGEDIRLGGDLPRLANSSQDTAAGLGKIVWHPTSHDEAKFSIQATRQAARIPSNTNSTTTTASSINDRVNRQLTYRLGYTHDNPANPYFNLSGFVYRTTLDITEFRTTDRRRDDINFDTTGYDLRNSMRVGDPKTHHHLLTYGSEFYFDSQSGSRGAGSLQSFPAADSDVFALYLQDEIRLWDRLTFIPAVRWDRWENRASGQADRSTGRVNPKIGGVIKATDFLFLEANYAQGFRAPTFGELFIAGTHFPGAVFQPNPNLSPERSRNIDAGFRIRLPRLLGQNDQFIVKGAYFRNTLKDFIDFKIVSFFPQLVFQARNVQDALIQGWETEVAWQVHPRVLFHGNYSQSHGTDETAQVPLTNIPQKRGVIGVDYFLAPLDLTVGARAQITGDQERVPAGVAETGGYAVYDIYLTYLPQANNLPPSLRWLQGLRIDAGIDNFTDRNYRRHLSGISEAGINPKVAALYTYNFGKFEP